MSAILPLDDVYSAPLIRPTGVGNAEWEIIMQLTCRARELELKHLSRRAWGEKMAAEHPRTPREIVITVCTIVSLLSAQERFIVRAIRDGQARYQ